MSYIKNSYGDDIDCFIVKARPQKIRNESSANLLTGEWFIQTVGTAAEKLEMEVVCKWDIVQEIMGYAVSKEILAISFLDFTENGIIIGMPEYDLEMKDHANPTYSVGFELAVIPGVS